MSTQFINKSVRLTLSDDRQLIGRVDGVNNGQLTLGDVKYLNIDGGGVGEQVKSRLIVKGNDIIDLDILPDKKVTQPPQKPPQKPQPAPAAPQPFMDPAILSAAPLTKQPPPANGVEEEEEEEEEEESSGEEVTAPYTALEFMSDTSSYAPSVAGINTPRKRNSNQRRKGPQQPNHLRNGSKPIDWETNDIKATDFDFQANLMLFDKKQVFNEIQQNDLTDPQQRLVAHNKITSNPHFVKYGHREMVLESKNSADTYDSKPEKGYRPRDPLHFAVASNLKHCPCASPVQIVELEHQSRECGISTQVLAENAGRGIAQIAVKVLGGAARFTVQNHNAKPLVVVLVSGCSATAGARALAAARHLANRQVVVVAVLVGITDEGVETSSMMSKEVKDQLKAFQCSNGRVVTRLESLISTLATYDSPPELIIDGLQGFQMTVDDLWDEDATMMLGLIDWANREKAGVMSIDIPSGLDPSTGLPSATKSSGSFVHAKWVAACGVPLSGLINAITSQVVLRDQWTVFAIDIGYPRAPLRSSSASSSAPASGSADSKKTSSSLRKLNKIWFGGEWVVELTIESL
ncbi:hypothetical protein TRVA0_006S01002 [Trichomonascus vanleenenianus]|uniref:Edc3p n=1 Tax=Trichomonascus vanleenenianus TaxID=2268995 RepID=UPI003EC9AC3E